MKKYLVTVTGVASLAAGGVTLEKRSAPYVVYLQDSEVTGLLALITSGALVVVEDLTDAVAVNGSELAVVDDIAVQALNNSNTALAQTSQIASRELTNSNYKKDIPTMATPPTITTAASSQISGGVLKSSLNGDFTISDLYTYAFDKIIRYSASFPDDAFVRSNAIISNAGFGYNSVEFGFYGDTFEILEFQKISKHKIMIDSGSGFEYVSQTATDLLTVGSKQWRKLVLASVGNYLVRIEFDNIYGFGGIVRPATSTVYKSTTIDDKPKIIIMGDSITEGTGSSNMNNYCQKIARKLNANVLNSGASGTGYVKNYQNSVKFVSRVDGDVIYFNPDLCLIAGGLNDQEYTVAEIVANATELYNKIINAKINLIVISSFYPINPWVTILDINTGLRNLCLSLKIPYIDILVGKTYDKNGNVLSNCGSSFIAGTGKVGTTAGDGNADLFTSADGSHPSPAGHEYLGVRIANEINLILKS